jgi:hypothetical protein
MAPIEAKRDQERLAHICCSTGAELARLCLVPLHGLPQAGGMASLAEKIKCEARMRELLEQEGVPLPDEVEYGFGCIRLFFHDPKVVVVVDIDDYSEIDEAIEKRAESAEAEDTAAVKYQERGPPFTAFPYPGPTQLN